MITPRFRLLHFLFKAPLSLVLLMAVLLLPRYASAQTAFGLRWFGEVRSPAPPRMLALGGLSTVQPWGLEPVAVGQSNPAFIARAERVLYSLTWEIGRLSGSYSDGEGSQWQTGPRMVGLVLPLGDGFSIGGGLQSHTTSEFEIKKSGEAPGGEVISLGYRGTGGLSQGAVGIAWELPSGLASVGLEADILFGSIKQEWIADFESLDYRDTLDRLQRQHLGNRWRFGLQLIPSDRLRLGAVFGTSGSLDVKYIRVTTDAVADTSEGKAQMGGSVLVGMGWKLNDLWAVYADYRHSAWNKMKWIEEPESGGSIGNISSGLSGLSADRDIGIGVERQARPLDAQVTFWDTLPIRVGIRLGTIYAPDLDGGRVTQWYGTLGTAQPVGREGRAWMDLALVIGRRISSGAGSAKEGFWRIQVGITGAERWFQPPQR